MMFKLMTSQGHDTEFKTMRITESLKFEKTFKIGSSSC